MAENNEAAWLDSLDMWFDLGDRNDLETKNWYQWALWVRSPVPQAADAVRWVVGDRTDPKKRHTYRRGQIGEILLPVYIPSKLPGKARMDFRMADAPQDGLKSRDWVFIAKPLGDGTMKRATAATWICQAARGEFSSRSAKVGLFPASLLTAPNVNLDWIAPMFIDVDSEGVVWGAMITPPDERIATLKDEGVIA